MDIRELRLEEILPALHLVWDVYVRQTAPWESEESVRAFQDYIRYDRIIQCVQSLQIKMYGVWEKDILIGVGAVDSNANITLLYVKTEYQRQGAGRRLFEEMADHACMHLQMNVLRVHAPVMGISFFEHMGMEKVDELENNQGIVFQPMIYHMTKKPGRAKRVIYITIAVALVLILLTTLIIGKEKKKEKTAIVIPNNPAIELPFEHGTEKIPEEEEVNGFESVEEYVVDGTTVSATAEQYVNIPEDMQNTIVEFQVNYPSFSGLDSKIEEKVNKELQRCAMQTVDELYENPDDETIEKMLYIEQPVLISYVDYRITYLSDEFASILFNDAKVEGNMETDQSTELRAVNIDLKTGEVYKLSDMIKINKEFIKDWRKKMKEETKDQEFLNFLSNEEIEKILKGKRKDEFSPVFFIKEDGIEIGLSFKISSDKEKAIPYQWVTAPFSTDEVDKYIKMH